jgi:hypothetical protein
MKPIYDLFKDSKSDEDTWVMTSLVAEDEEFEEIKSSGQYLLSPYVEYYGCKWDFLVEDCDLNDLNPTSLEFSVSTAWSPPEPFCLRLSEKYGVDVEITFFEGGANFAGRSYYSEGEEIESETYSYREGMYYLDSEVFWIEVDSDMEWIFCENPDITLDEVLGSMYPFVTDEDDKEKIKESYNEWKEHYETTEETESEV